MIMAQWHSNLIATHSVVLETIQNQNWKIGESLDGIISGNNEETIYPGDGEQLYQMSENVFLP